MLALIVLSPEVPYADAKLAIALALAASVIGSPTAQSAEPAASQPSGCGSCI